MTLCMNAVVHVMYCTLHLWLSQAKYYLTAWCTGAYDNSGVYVLSNRHVGIMH